MIPYWTSNMKQLYTSNYARCGRNENAYAISARPPEWYGGERLLFLAPHWSDVRAFKYGAMSEEEYTRRYLHKLEVESDLNPQDVADALPDGAILLCYERPNEFCHRHVFAEWLRQADGIRIEEWKTPSERKKAIHLRHVETLLEF